jgi:hypothetical protein
VQSLHRTDRNQSDFVTYKHPSVPNSFHNTIKDEPKLDYADANFNFAKNAGDLSQSGNRANYLHNLQKRKAEDRQLKAMQRSEVFKGFSREQIKEIMFEMPELRKEEKKLEKNKPYVPPKTTKMLNLDAIEEMQTKASK